MVSTGSFGWLKATLYGLLFRSPKSNRVVVDAAELGAGDRVLDVGCGAGAALEYASELVTDGRLAGVDPTPKLARKAAERVPEAVVEVAGVESLPFDDDAFDVAWSISAFHHWPDPEAGLSEVRRVLELGGRLLIAEWHNDRPGGHGLDDSEIELLRKQMTATGYSEPTVSLHDVGRRQMAIVTAEV